MKKQATPKATPAAVRFVIRDGFRPSAGTRLASHTAAVLGLTGMIDGAMIPAAELRQMIGDTAFGYHSRKGNIERTDKGAKLSEQGVLLFMARAGVDPEMIAAYETVLSTGKPDGNLIKVPEAIAPLKPTAKAAQ
jgi:hypothetical protein